MVNLMKHRSVLDKSYACLFSAFLDIPMPQTSGEKQIRQTHTMNSITLNNKCRLRQT